MIEANQTIADVKPVEPEALDAKAIDAKAIDAKAIDAKAEAKLSNPGEAPHLQVEAESVAAESAAVAAESAAVGAESAAVGAVDASKRSVNGGSGRVKPSARYMQESGDLDDAESASAWTWLLESELKKDEQFFKSKEDADASVHLDQVVGGQPVGVLLGFPNPSAIKPAPEPSEHQSKVAESKAAEIKASSTSWDYQYQPRAAIETQRAADSYNVICAIALGNARRFIEDAWCEFLLYQHQLIAMIGCLVIDQKHPSGTVRFFAPDRDALPAAAGTSKTKASASSEGQEVEDMEAFRRLMDGATRIYCFNEHELFGMLRASPGDATDLATACRWAPFDGISDPARTQRNPFRPGPNDPYAHVMAADVPHPTPTREDAEEITIPDIVIPPDPDWPPLTALQPSNPTARSPAQSDAPPQSDAGPKPDVSKESSAAKGGAGLQGASHYNSGDTPEDIARYLSSERWRGATTVDKPSPPYLRDGEMIYWMFKCFSVTADAEIEGMGLSDLVAWNAHQTWWSHDALRLPVALDKRGRPRKPTKAEKRLLEVGVVDFARRAYRGPAATSNRIIGQIQYTGWSQHRRWADIQGALEWELRVLADLMTVLYAHHLPVLAHVKKFNRERKRYEEKWVRASISVCTPSVLQCSHARAEPPPSLAPGSDSGEQDARPSGAADVLTKYFAESRRGGAANAKPSTDAKPPATDVLTKYWAESRRGSANLKPAAGPSAGKPVPLKQQPRSSQYFPASANDRTAATRPSPADADGEADDLGAPTNPPLVGRWAKQTSQTSSSTSSALARQPPPISHHPSSASIQNANSRPDPSRSVNPNQTPDLRMNDRSAAASRAAGKTSSGQDLKTASLSTTASLSDPKASDAKARGESRSAAQNPPKTAHNPPKSAPNVPKTAPNPGASYRARLLAAHNS